MKKLIRAFTLVTSLVLVFSMLSACSTATPQAQTSAPIVQATASEASTVQPTTTITATATATEAVKVDTSKKIKISMATYGQYAVAKDAKYLKIMDDKYNIDLDIWECYGDEYITQVNARIAGGEIPDIINMSPGLSVPEYVKQGIIIEVPETFIQQYLPKYYADLYSTSQAPFKYCKINGKNYGIPGTSADGIYHFTVIWRSDWLKNVGIDKTPETIDEFEAAFYKFTNEDPDKNGKKDTYGLSNLGMIPVFGAFGYIPYNNSPDKLAEYNALKDNKIVHASTQPEMKDALKLLNKWYKDGVIDPEFVTGERKEGHWSASQAFATGRIGYTSSGMYYNTGRTSEIGRDGRVYKLVVDTQKALGNTTADYIHGRPPIGKDGKSGTIKWGVEEGVCFAFGKSLENDLEKQIRIAMWFDDLWMTQDNYMSAIYGIKGVDWTQDSATGALQTGLGPDTKEAFANDETTKIGLGFMFVPDVVSAMKKETPKYYEFADKVASYTPDYVDPVGGAPLESVTKYGTDLAKITLTAYYDMITGKKDVDTYFDQYVKQWEAAGGIELLKEANDWWSANGSSK